jgi:hypothetical protein
MKRLATKVEQLKRYEGRLSDRSDWVEVTDNIHTVTVLDEGGRTVDLTFDHAPTDDEIVTQLPAPTDIDPGAGVGRARLRDTLQEAATQAMVADWLSTKVNADPTSTAGQKAGASLLASVSYARARTLAGRFNQAT